METKSDAKISLDDLLNKKDGRKQISKLKFEEGMSLLEGLVAKVESGNLALDKSVDAYELSAELLKHLRSLLGEAEGKLKTLKENASGDIVVK